MKKSLYTPEGVAIFSPTQLASLRVLIASFVLMPFVMLRSAKKILAHWLPLMAVGFFGNFIPAFLFANAQTKVNSSLAGILNALVPLFTLLISVVIFKIKLRKISYVGIILGFVGTALLFLNGSAASLFNEKITVFPLLLIVLATFMYAISANVIKHKLSKLRSEEVAGGALFFVVIPAAVIAFSSNVTETIYNMPEAKVALFYVSLLAVFGTAVAVVFYAKLIAETNAVFASTVTYLMPVVAVFWGVLDGEQIHVLQVIAMVLILVGIKAVNSK